MEENFYHTDFEDFIKDKADQYKMYPSDKVWKGIDRSLRSRRKWYWTGFVVLLTGVSYFAITELIAPTAPIALSTLPSPAVPKPQVTADQLAPFPTAIADDRNTLNDPANIGTVTSDLMVEDSGNITASFEIPLMFLPGHTASGSQKKAAFLISGLEPLGLDEAYNIELSWPLSDADHPSESAAPETANQKIPLNPLREEAPDEKPGINWFQDHARLQIPPSTNKRISWQLAFSPTVNYRKLTGSNNAKLLSQAQNIPLALQIDGDLERLVNHKPALGFELGTHGLIHLNNRITFKGGIQFNYSKYDITAFRAPSELATIALNSQLGTAPNSLLSYTNIRNFGGSSVEVLKNQYYQLSLPVGFEVRIFGNEKLQFNIASTVQPTYLINRNTYLITTDYKNYTKAPSLVRRWNVNAGAEAFISYNRGNVKWQLGPQFRYQLLSSYQNEYPIKEYLMEYGIKVGITKTIR